jgi:hypothetical protein
MFNRSFVSVGGLTFFDPKVIECHASRPSTKYLMWFSGAKNSSTSAKSAHFVPQTLIEGGEEERITRKIKAQFVLKISLRNACVRGHEGPKQNIAAKNRG